jgi:cytochrome c biogenesis protein CcmG, thiol:disulfide interchange protein DsbE
MNIVIRRVIGPLLAATLALGCETPDTTSIRALQVGDEAPDYAAATVFGDTLRLADLRGDVVLLNIWATWCIPCREEMPALQRLHREYGEVGLRVVGVSIDAAGMMPDILHFTDQFAISFPILHDPAEGVMRAFRARAVPETFLIDREGRIAQRWIGKFDPYTREALSTLERTLNSR